MVFADGAVKRAAHRDLVGDLLAGSAGLGPAQGAGEVQRGVFDLEPPQGGVGAGEAQRGADAEFAAGRNDAVGVVDGEDQLDVVGVSVGGGRRE